VAFEGWVMGGQAADNPGMDQVQHSSRHTLCSHLRSWLVEVAYFGRSGRFPPIHNYEIAVVTNFGVVRDFRITTYCVRKTRVSKCTSPRALGVIMRTLNHVPFAKYLHLWGKQSSYICSSP
jgi:hypothetical protein